jgi:CMP-N,N'-diacetyllegionaminic acid synthase
MGAIICLIPARGGSKGIPMKNIVPIAGKPLVAWSIERALRSPSVGGNVYVSSDDPQILNIAKKHGARSIQRPAEISGDTASSESALLHAICEIEKELGIIDYVVFLQATSPIRGPDDIENAVQKIKKENADSLLSVQTLKDYFIWDIEDGKAVSKNFDYKNRKRRQDIPPTYLENGSIYVFKPEILRRLGNRLGGKIALYEMDKIHSQQIDDQEELELCEYLLQRYADAPEKS